MGSGKSFRKSLRNSQTIQEEEENPLDPGLKDKTVDLSRDRSEVEGESDSTMKPNWRLKLDPWILHV